MNAPFRPCVLIPTYDNPRTIRDVALIARAHADGVIVVDDGSAEEGRREVEALGKESIAIVSHREKNGGKGAAVKTGLIVAQDHGFTHALQIDADGQHASDDIPRFLEAARSDPEALILGAPLFDDSAPRARVIGRKITQFWTNLETIGRTIHDPLCGFRVYPIARAIRANARGNAMDFDPEIAVRMVWQGTRVVNIPTRVRYVSAADGGVSHFRLGMDNVLISWMHTRMVFGAIIRSPLLITRRVRALP